MQLKNNKQEQIVRIGDIASFLSKMDKKDLFVLSKLNDNEVRVRKFKYRPKTKKELKSLCDDESVNLGSIDTSLITDMSYLFHGSKRKDFSGIEEWDTSNVKNMEGMFLFVAVFDRPIGVWDVSNVENMKDMFKGAEIFNQPIETWDVSNVKEMKGMFLDAKSFKQELNQEWADEAEYVKPLVILEKDGKYYPKTKEELKYLCDDDSVNLGDIDTKDITDMKGLFKDFKRKDFSGLENWDVSNVTNMESMFENAEFFNEPIGKWNVSNKTNMYHIVS